MKSADVKRLLLVFAVLEFGLAAVMFVVFRHVAIGASQVAIGTSLIAMAVATDKKKSNG